MDYESNAFNLLYTDRNVVIRFFVVMSRFEYAVKRMGERNRGSVNWTGYAKKLVGIDLSNNTDEKLSEAIGYLVSQPPQKLDSDMKWETWKPQNFKSDLSKAFMSITQVRNNLFHGRKGDNRERNNKLVEASLVVPLTC
ncbi:hypothetical protein QWA_03235 [Alcaligenes faecalis subsp. faecalis NCIB 8687]|nr:hypothetical protein QWA_03235 [Alcaligenes faecalis subsp. faecalis NCIB 8687]